jgi:hypothetical protein
VWWVLFVITLVPGRGDSDREHRGTAVRSFPIFAALVTVTLAMSATPAAAQTIGRAPAAGAVVVRDEIDGVSVARDVSFPQCGAPLPALSSGSAGVLGVNDGSSFTTNRCLVPELAWAKRLASAPAFYTNTGNPGPARTEHWPIGQTSPKVCSAADPNSLACSFEYGWNAGRQAFGVAADAARRLHHVDADAARHRAANVEWWLDVETMNSWLTITGAPTRAAEQRDTAALVGQFDALLFAGVTQIGIYSTPYQWGVITGGTRAGNAQFGPTAQWLAGYGSKAAATAGCSDNTFMPGSVQMTQYLAHDGFDADVICTGPDPA